MRDLITPLLEGAAGFWLMIALCYSLTYLLGVLQRAPSAPLDEDDVDEILDADYPVFRAGYSVGVEDGRFQGYVGGRFDGYAKGYVKGLDDGKAQPTVH